MTWFKFDDGFHSHPKVQALFEGPCPGDAIALFTLAGSWCSKELTDGAVPLGFVRRSGLHKEAADELVRVRLFDACEDASFRVHNYLKYNPSRAQVLAEREKTKQRVTRHRNGGSNAVTEGVTPGVSQTVPPENIDVSTLAPVPVPDPVPNSLPDKNSYPPAAEPSYAHADARESGGGGTAEPDAVRGSRWLHEALGGHHAYDYSPRSKHRHALTLLARKPETELAAARAALERERMKPGVLDMLTPQHVIDYWPLYSKGKAPGKPAANGGGRKSGPSRVPTAEEYEKAREEKAPWET